LKIIGQQNPDNNLETLCIARGLQFPSVPSLIGEDGANLSVVTTCPARRIKEVIC
jgi:hypothetical protein